MIAEYFSAFFVIIILLLITEKAGLYTTANDFQYTACLWKKERCQPTNVTEYISLLKGPGREGKTSYWPKGPYALLTPQEGCPESVEKGWRSGYLSFTWKHPHTLMSSSSCDVNNKHNQSLEDREGEDTNATDVGTCWHYLTPDVWPENRSGLLGPYSRYAFRLNFCFMTEKQADPGDSPSWPTGSYSIFNDEKDCPSGFTSSVRKIKLPAALSWTSYGLLPDFTVKTKEADNSITLTLKTCDHQTDNLTSNEANNQHYISTDSFIFLKNDPNISCSQFRDSTVVDERLRLHADTHVEKELIELFTFCYYRPDKWLTGLDTYLYQHVFRSTDFLGAVFQILNPTFLYGKKTIRMDNSLDIEFGAHTFKYQTVSIPWLLIDLGRRFIVAGLQFTNFLLAKVDSKEYRGTLDSVFDGAKCQRWDEHLEVHRDDQFPDNTVSDAENYCRDPSGQGNIWCYVHYPYILQICVDRVFRFQPEDRPFSKYFISDNKWRMDEFDAISCPYTANYIYYSEKLEINFLKKLEGRYVKLVGHAETEISRFVSLVRNVEVVTSSKMFYDESMCNEDLGMGDKSIHDFQITASTWLQQSLPEYSRTFFPGWCSEISDKTPLITVDMMKDIRIEGITVFNWEQTVEDVINGIYKKKYVSVGCKKIMVAFSTELNKGNSLSYINKTFNLDMFLPIEQPHTFIHEPVFARYITVYILESMTENAKCLRFELHGCRQNGYGDNILPELVGPEWFGLSSINNLLTIKHWSVLSSIDYPLHYSGGMSYTWIIDFLEGNFIRLVFSNTSFNVYNINVLGQCNDTLTFLPGAYTGETMHIDQRFNGLVTLIETEVSYASLTFTTCRATSRIEHIGHGFKAIINSQVTPTCFILSGMEDNKLKNFCTQPAMHLTSLSQFNFPYTLIPEEWMIYMYRLSFYLEFVYFNIRCDTGSLLYIKDRFSGDKSLCNLRMISSRIYPDSLSVFITFEKGQNGIIPDNNRETRKEGFRAVYRTFHKPMRHLIDSEETNEKAFRALAWTGNDNLYESLLKNATMFEYKACSKKFGKCYYIHSGGLTTWNTAGGECWIRKSRLVSIHSDEEHELIKYILRNLRHFNNLGPDIGDSGFYKDKADPYYFTHIGLFSIKRETGSKVHVWEDGSPVTFSAWNLKNTLLDGDCTRMGFRLFNTNNTWEPEVCHKGLARYFICEQKLTQERLEPDDVTPMYTAMYRGRLSKTLSGRTCRRWDETYDREYENYCRDPTQRGMLVCFTTDPGMIWDICSSKDTASDRCYSTHARYNGQWNKTISGKTCQPWVSQSPHDHEIFIDSQFPDGNVGNASNFCRDPYNEGYLWCFTTDPATKSEPCLFEYKYQLSGKTQESATSNNTFQCGNGDIIPRQYLCNGNPNCVDLTDEKDCTNKVHRLMKNLIVAIEIPTIDNTKSMFQCESKEWISTLARCDRLIDCIDATDEVNCSSSQGAPGCSEKEYSCDDGGCIHTSQMCDFIADCTDSSDEYCDYPLCSNTEYRCQNQQCIPKENRCDAYTHCLDGTDETSCDACKDNTFHCDLIRCIPRRLVCDRYEDCRDGSDERSCDQPIRYFCEEWWNAGYRKSGIYLLNDTDVECNFDNVHKDGTIYTIFHNFEITTRYGAELIHSTENELMEQQEPFNSIFNKFILNSTYICFQNITQSCVLAYKAVADYEDPDYEDAYKYCDCLVMTVNPGHSDTNVTNTYYCNSDDLVTDKDKLLFHYHESLNKRHIYLKDNFPTGVDVTIGPAVCKHESKFDDFDISCGDGKVFPANIRCIYDTDPAGFILGCRSGQHLQGCELFQCPQSTVKCPGSFCLPLKFICDGHIHCPGGQDEEDCGCQDDDREVVLLYEDSYSYEENQKVRSIATQFYTVNSIVRELRYRVGTLPETLDFDHRMLDISDTEIASFSATDRQFVCNYSILASDLINSIEFSKANARGIIFFQKGKVADTVTKMIFGNLKSKPEFLLYRVIHDTYTVKTELESPPFVKDVVLKQWSALATVGAMFFPDLCTEAAKMYCPYGYRCAASKTCIPLDQVCDGHAQCVHGDDERSCGYFCPKHCSCFEHTTDCSFSNTDESVLPILHNQSRSLDLSGNPGLRKTLIASEWHFPYLILLNMSKCDIKEIRNNTFQTLVNLRILDLSFNKFETIPGSAFIGLRKLKNLNLFGNTAVYSLDPFSLSGLLSIRSLEIKGATIRKLYANTFAGLDLDEIIFFDNEIMEMEDGVFSQLNVKVIDIETNKIKSFDKGVFKGVKGIVSLRAPAYKYCCVRPTYLAEENCSPKKNAFSSCDDLLRLSSLQTMFWLIGILALFGNILSIIYRLVYDRDRFKFGYGIFVTNLAVADFLMGLYLIIVAIADTVYRKRYIFMDDFWRNSAWCTIAGFLSTVSSEASVFFLCLITIDRLFVIKYPFGQVRFDTKTSGIACFISWLVALSVAVVPILYSGYFHGRFYSKSGVCIALPLTRDRPPGWLYSIIIFVGLNFVTFCLIAIGQIIIYLEIKSATSRIRRHSKVGSGRRRELTVARNLLFVVATDFLCWFPIGCMGLISMSGHMIPADVYAWTAVLILPVNSALNPVLYTLTTVLGNKKAALKRNKIISPMNTNLISKYKNIKPFNGLFRHFMIRQDNIGQTFISLDDLSKKAMTLRTADIVLISFHLLQSIRILHKHSLVMTKLDGSLVYAVVKDKIISDIQLSIEPTVCYDTDEKAENIYQFGEIIRRLLSKRNLEKLA